VQYSPPTIGIGQRVRARGRIWRVDSTERGTQGTWVSLRAEDDAGPACECCLIWPHDPLPAAPEPRLRRAARRRTAGLVLAALARERQADDLWCAVDADIDVHPWQLAPVAAVLRGTTRVLLADDVGLGKTVEASLIMAELRARGLMRRALVLAPVALTQAWLDTLRTRFHLDAALVTARDLQRWQHRPAAAGNPWQQSLVTVASIDLAKQPTAWASLEAVGLDVLVVDEAHHAAPSTARGALVAHLAARTPWVVLCTATPHTGDRAQFEALCRLGESGPAPEAPMHIFRRTRSVTAMDTPGRSVTVLQVRLSAAEALLQARLDAYLQALHSGPSRHEPGLQLLCSVLTRRLASSPEALRKTLQHRRDSLVAAPDSRATVQPSLFEASDDDEDGETDPWSGRAGLGDLRDERLHLTQLLALADGAGVGAKGHALQRLLRRTTEPLVVFSEFRATVLATARAVSASQRTAVLHGGLTPEVRAHVLESFLRGAARVLLTTDVAGEGLNLQHRARLVVTLDWPWRPHRLEQRIGRVDRLGQRRRVHALVLSARTSSDEGMHGVLQQHSTVADADLRAHPTVTGTDAASLTLAERVRQRRRWRSDEGTGRAGSDLAGAWAPSRRRRVSHLMVAGLVRHLSSEGHVLSQQVVALAITLRAAVSGRAAWRRLVWQVAADARVHAACRRAAHVPSCASHGPRHGAAVRIGHIRHQLSQSAQADLQPSMFETRAEARVIAALRARTCLDAHLAATAQRLDDLAASSPSGAPHDPVTIIAVLPPSRVAQR